VDVAQGTGEIDVAQLGISAAPWQVARASFAFRLRDFAAVRTFGL
jgi:hypothetical protein